MVTNYWQVFFSRLLFAFVNIGVGTSYLIQRPYVTPPPRKYLESFPVPFWIYGVVFITAGLLILVAIVMYRAYWVYTLFQVVVIFWAIFALAYLEPVFADPIHVLWSGFVLYLFVGLVHQAAALIEVHRV